MPAKHVDLSHGTIGTDVNSQFHRPGNVHSTSHFRIGRTYRMNNRTIRRACGNCGKQNKKDGNRQSGAPETGMLDFHSFGFSLHDMFLV